MKQAFKPYSNNMYEYHELKRQRFAIEKPQVKKNKIIFIGDSIVDGWDLNHYFPDYTCYNRGIGGDTSYGVLRRFKDDVIDLEPMITVMLFGVNDLNQNIPWQEVVQNYRTMIIACNEKLPISTIIVISILPINSKIICNYAGKPQDLMAINEELQKLCFDNIKFVDIFTYLKNSRNNDMREIYTEDGLHPNQKGYEKMAEITNKAILQLVKANPNYKTVYREE